MRRARHTATLHGRAVSHPTRRHLHTPSLQLAQLCRFASSAPSFLPPHCHTHTHTTTSPLSVWLLLPVAPAGTRPPPSPPSSAPFSPVAHHRTRLADHTCSCNRAFAFACMFVRVCVCLSALYVSLHFLASLALAHLLSSPPRCLRRHPQSHSHRISHPHTHTSRRSWVDGGGVRGSAFLRSSPRVFASPRVFVVATATATGEVVTEEVLPRLRSGDRLPFPPGGFASDTHACVCVLLEGACVALPTFTRFSSTASFSFMCLHVMSS